MIETLESRVLFTTVADSAFAGPLVAKASFNYSISAGGKLTAYTQHRTVIGAAKFNGASTIEIDTTYTGPKSALTSLVSRHYEALSTTKGLIDYGHTDTSTSTAGKITTTTVTTDTDIPPATLLSPTVTLGKTYTIKYSQKEVTTINGKTSSTSTLSKSVVFAFAAGTTVISTSAGKFTCYEVTITETTNKVPGPATMEYFAPGVGLVKAVSGTGANQTVLLLSSYKI